MISTLRTTATTTLALSLALSFSWAAGLAETINYNSQGGKTTTYGAQSSTVVRPSGTSAVSTTTTKTTSATSSGFSGSTKTTSTTTSTATTKGTGGGADLVALQGPKQILHSGTTWKESPTSINIKQGQEILPLTMTFTNGVNNTSKLTGLRVLLNGRKLANESYFRGSDKFSIDMTGLLSPGDNQLAVQTFGPAGSTVGWVLTTNKIKVSDIKPDNGAAGDKISITGKNLPKLLSAYKIFVGKQPAVVKSVTDKQIDFIVPTGLDGEKQTVTLYIAGVKCDPLYLKMKSAPEITGVNMIETTPASAFIVSGKGFSTKASENVVTVGGTACTVNSASATSLDCFLPESISCPQRDIAVQVKTNGIEAKGAVTMCVTMRTIRSGESLPNDGLH